VSKKRQAVTIVSIAAVSFLIGTMLNSMTMAADGGSPWNQVWETIYRLETQVNELKRPQARTITGHVDWTQLTASVWTDLLSISEVTVSEGANVLAIASGCFNCSEVTQAALRLRHRANETYGEELFQGFTGKKEGDWMYGTAKEMIEIHCLWTDLSAGTYSFGIQYYVCGTREIQMRNSRLTLIIF